MTTVFVSLSDSYEYHRNSQSHWLIYDFSKAYPFDILNFISQCLVIFEVF